MSRLVIVDYGAGNLRSVANALTFLGSAYEVSGDKSVIEGADSLILPGVGHFGPLMDALRLGKSDESIRSHIAADKPFLGICLGMQALFEGSEESPEAGSLGIATGKVQRLSGGVKVPHIGWDTVSISKGSKLFAGIPSGAHFYFAHSYALPVVPSAVATCDYGRVEADGFCAAVEHGNMFGTQFHPEKSGEAGLQLFKNFLEAARC